MPQVTTESETPSSAPGQGRRRFLARLGWLGGVLALDSSQASAAWTPPTHRGRLTAHLQALVPHTVSAVVVGREYLRAAPHERKPGKLAALISEVGGDGEPGVDVDELRRRVDRRIRRDFDEGRIVTLQGWMLSLTEVRICALLALCQEPG